MIFFPTAFVVVAMIKGLMVGVLHVDNLEGKESARLDVETAATVILLR